MNSNDGYECENCRRRFPRLNQICPSCEYPIGGTEDDKNLFYHKLETARAQLKGMEEKVYQAKLCLWIIAGLNLLYALVYYLFQSDSDDSFLILLLNLFVSIVFVILAISANDRPYTALIAGLFVYLALIIYHIINDQTGISMFAIVRYGLIVWIAIGISNTSQVEHLKKEISRRTGVSK